MPGEGARVDAAREAEQEQEQYQSAIDRTRMALAQQQDTAIQTLTRLEEAYTPTAPGSLLRRVSRALELFLETHEAS